MLKLKYYLKKDILDISKWIDAVLLQIYRTTSEHHTNFTTILNFTTIMIVIYFILLLTYSKLLYFANDSTIEFYNITILVCTALFMIFIRKINQDTIIIKIFTRYLYNFYAFILLYLVLLYVYFTNIKSCYIAFCLTLQITMVIIVYYIYLKAKKAGNIMYKLLILCSYIWLFIIILIKPAIINPFISIFNTDSSLIDKRLEMILQDTPNHILISLAKDLTKQNSTKYYYVPTDNINIVKDIIKENQRKLLGQNDEKYLQNIDYQDIINAARYDYIMSDIFKTTSVIYSIILLLCIFSLQKTARKNSIIPS